MDALKEVLAIRARENLEGASPDADALRITGADPVYNTRFRIGDTCAAVIGGIGLAVSDLWELKTGRPQQARVDTRHAAAGLNSSRFMRSPDSAGAWQRHVSDNHQRMLAITQPWQTRDGQWFLPHFGLPNLQAKVLNVLNCEPTPESVSAAVSQWDALELEGAIDEARACGAMVRTNDQWMSTAHGKVLAGKPIVEIIKIADSDPEPLPAGDRPLSGIRALDLTRILAGPIAARTLAENGADVLMVTADGLPQIPEHVMDTSHGKRSTYLNLTENADAAMLKELVRGTDVFSQGYRPGVLEGLGFGPERLAELRPGIVSLSISCFGADGEFSHRAGWEQVAQTVTGICHDNGDDRPRLLPGAACDYTTGYLGAYGVLLALGRRAREGGSYHVRVSLCQSGMLIYRQGQLATPSVPDINDQELDGMSMDSQTVYGPLRHLRPVLQLSETNPYWDKPTPELGGDIPVWLDATNQMS